MADFNPSTNRFTTSSLTPSHRRLTSIPSSQNYLAQLTQQPEIRSIQEIYHIAWLLRQILVPDLVPEILGLADIYAITIIRKRLNLAVTRERSPEICLVTPPIWPRVRKKNPVAKVTFRILACDEGLALEIGRSYFTATRLGGHVWEGEGLAGVEKAMRYARPSSAREICTNSIAAGYFEQHEVEWERDEDWVSGLRAGDRIVVRAHAQWATFENRVAEVEVRVHTPAVVR